MEIHSTFWFKDGSVVLIASKSAGFKVHMSVLSRHSSVFDDLFSVPQPEEAERVENCPVVHVPDEPEDMAHLLFALYDGRRSVYGRPSSR